MHQGLESRNDPASGAVVQLADFQKAFNGVDVDLRGSPEARGELLLRCNELQDVLWELCDQRMDDSQAKLSILKYAAVTDLAEIFTAGLHNLFWLL